MRRFEAEPGWVPGPRWITHARLGTAALDLGDAYLASAHRWWQACGDGRRFDQIIDVLPRHRRHITLTLVDRPATQVSTEHLDQLHDAIATRVTQFEPFALTFGPAIPCTVALELYLAPCPALTALRNTVADAYRAVFGPTAQPEPRTKSWRAHTALGYCRQPFDHNSLASALLRTPGPVAGYLGSVTSPVDTVLLVCEDTFSPTGLVWHHTTKMPLAGNQRPDPGRPV